MPEYLAPGVYVEETSFRSKSIEGVSTSTAGFVGPASFGPVGGNPELLTSFADFERIYGGFDDLNFEDADGNTVTSQFNYLAHGVRTFFEEGGRRLFVSRVFDNNNQVAPAYYAASNTDAISPPPPQVVLQARFPGRAGNMRVIFSLRPTGNAFNPTANGGPTLARVREFDVVFVGRPQPLSPPGTQTWAPLPNGTDGLFVVRRNQTSGNWELRGNGPTVQLSSLSTEAQVLPLSLLVEVARPMLSTGGFLEPELMGEFSFDPRSANGLTRTFKHDPDTRFLALTVPFEIILPEDMAGQAADELPLSLARELLGDIGALLEGGFTATLPPYTLAGGSDGLEPGVAAYEAALTTFEAVEDISIVASPGYTAGFGPDQDQQDRVLAIQNALINHCEKMKYLIAVLDTPQSQMPTGALDFRNKRSSKYAAMYYPWIVVANPVGTGRLALPPSGFVAGIYARNDIQRAVFKAPANEVVSLAIDFETLLSKAHQELLNPQGLNCFRFFEGRGFLLWGARTISDDPEWKYVNLRRYFAYLEHSLDRGTQWAVFENNGPQLWGNVRRTIEDFLLNEWKMGALLGDKPEQAYFVRCDLSTMTQNDLDNGRLICLIGVAPVRPAEFVIFRIGQWTASTK